jgi:hypothetical protein
MKVIIYNVSSHFLQVIISRRSYWRKWKQVPSAWFSGGDDEETPALPELAPGAHLNRRTSLRMPGMPDPMNIYGELD